MKGRLGALYEILKDVIWMRYLMRRRYDSGTHHDTASMSPDVKSNLWDPGAYSKQSTGSLKLRCLGKCCILGKSIQLSAWRRRIVLLHGRRRNVTLLITQLILLMLSLSPFPDHGISFYSGLGQQHCLWTKRQRTVISQSEISAVPLRSGSS